MTQLVIPGDDSAGEPPNVDETVTLGSYASGGSRYRILRPIGRGGVGEVWLARDVELNRDVAIKQLLARHRDKDDFRRRFLREVKATAALEHPGIIPVYDIGQHPDGTLFQVMRYFGEENFHSLIRDYHRDHPSAVDDAAFRGLLGHFIAACRAIAYVHARDVVHLDLKPANVVTGEFGETQVIDWGMAWIRGQALWERVAEESGALSGGASGGDSGQSGGASDAAKLAGSRPVPDMTRPVGFRGTPAYAAPEQHRGRWDAIGSRTDVYGLGATLFFLLADKAPFAVQSDSFHTDVLAGHLQAEPKPWVPRALVAIARKAMAVDPANRYASAAELADDVDRFLADEPVTAFPDPWQTRLWRQVKRHRTAVSTAAALLLTSAVALGIGYVAVSWQRDRAERNAAMTREVVDQFIERIADDEWGRIPGTAELRLDAVREVVGKYAELLEQKPDDPELRLDAAMIFRRCANLFRVLGRYEEALPLYLRGRRLMEGVLDRHPGIDRYRAGMTLNLIDEAEVLLMTVGPDRALPVFREAVANVERTEGKSAESASALAALGQARMDLADALVAAGRIEEAVKTSAVAVADFEAALVNGRARAPADVEQDRKLAVLAHAVAARALAEAGRWREAATMARTADRASAELLDPSQENQDHDYVRAVALTELGRILGHDTATAAEGAAVLERAVAILRRIAAADEEETSYVPALSQALCLLGAMRLDAGDATAAAALADESIEALAPLDRDEDAVEVKRLLAVSLAVRGRAARMTGDAASAERTLRRSRAAYRVAVAAAASNRRLRDEAEDVERLLGE